MIFRIFVRFNKCPREIFRARKIYDMEKKIKTAVIGFGRMGEFYLNAMEQSGELDVACICDISEASRDYASKTYPGYRVISDSDEIFADSSIEAVVLSTLANSRKELIRKAIRTGKHIIAEKPVAATVEDEWEMVSLAEGSGVLTTVNLYLRNSWYHKTLNDFIKSGEIGELAIMRICHMTPGLAPGEGHEFEGPAFHDCGMHYVDIARWYAQSEFRTWHAQGIRMWDYKDPWWIQCHGTFMNGIVYDITQGFVYGQLSKDQTHNSYVDLIGTKGIARMTHDFKTATVELRGVTRTEIITKPFGGKNIDTLCRKFAKSIRTGKRDETLPSFRDSAIASDYAWKFIGDACSHDLPSIGDHATLEQIRERRRKMSNGYGLLTRHSERTDDADTNNKH